MSNWDKERLLRSTILAGFAAAVVAGAPALAQEPEDEDEAVDAVVSLDAEREAEEQGAATSDRVVVTGSRLRRDEFSSAAPIQVISGDVSRDIGLVSPDVILQDSTVTQGQQIDGSFAGFVLDNGPGSSTVDLRGLGANRTLILVNGRRLAPSGVEGAPASPSVNTLPGAIVDRYELLLDGASSVYGSDAVAGVVNVILQQDFDGLEVNAFTSQTEDGGAEQNTVSAAWGINSDRGFAGFAIEYRTQENQQRRDRDWSSTCLQDVEITEDGEIRTLRLDDNFSNDLQAPSVCERPRLVGRVSIPILGSVYANEFANVIAPNGNFYPGFSESNYLSIGGQGGSIGIDSDGDGLNDVQFVDYSPNGSEEWLSGDVLPENETFNFFTYGEYDSDLFGGTTFFYEALYSNLQVRQNGIGSGGGAQLFPTVPGSNPYNICNPNGFGVDCGVAFDNFFLSQAYSDNFQRIVGPPSAAFFGGFASGPLGPQDVVPIVRVRGDRNTTNVEIAQTRMLGGFRGDIPALNFASVRDWQYEVTYSYSRSVGDSSRVGIRDDLLAYSLNTSAIDPATGNVVCGEDSNGDGVPDGIDLSGNQCVPVNLFAPSLYNGGEAGDFATQAERDYLFGDRSFNTIYEQSVFTAFANGTIFELPAGSVPLAVGFEYREDVIDSNASDIAARGLLFGFFQDSGASGSKDLYEGFGEIELPIFAGQPFAYEANLNLSARFTDEEFFGEAWTYSAKGDYRPVEWLLLRGTAGTSFRAPNVREQFVAAQSGFNNALGDPCLVPQSAFTGDPLNPAAGSTYDPAADPRDNQTLDNCRAAGIDPTTFGVVNGQPSATGTVSAEVIFGGTTDIDPEESTSYSAGFVVEQPYFDQFDLTFGATWWSIEIEDALIEPSSQFIVNDCYVLQPNLSSGFCSRIERGADNFINVVRAQPINLNSETRSGIDFNMLFEDDFVVFERSLDLTVDLRATHLLEVETLLIDELGNEDVDDFLGSFGFAEWNGQATLAARYEDFRFTWNTRYIGDVTQFAEGVDDFSNVPDGGSSTCLGPAFGDVNCRDYAEADAYFRHDMSVAYVADTWNLVVGVRNLLDENPPFVNSSEVTTNVNAPVGRGYDLQGRRFFASVSKQF